MGTLRMSFMLVKGIGRARRRQLHALADHRASTLR